MKPVNKKQQHQICFNLAKTLMQMSKLHTCVKDAIWDEESSHSYANQHQELEEPETER